MTKSEFIILLHSCINPTGRNWHADAGRFLFVHPRTIAYNLKHGPSPSLAHTLKKLYAVYAERKQLHEWSRTAHKRTSAFTVVHGYAPRFLVSEIVEPVVTTGGVGHRRSGLEWYWLDPEPNDPVDLYAWQQLGIKVLDGLDPAVESWSERKPLQPVF